MADCPLNLLPPLFPDSPFPPLLQVSRLPPPLPYTLSLQVPFSSKPPLTVQPCLLSLPSKSRKLREGQQPDQGHTVLNVPAEGCRPDPLNKDGLGRCLRC